MEALVASYCQFLWSQGADDVHAAIGKASRGLELLWQIDVLKADSGVIRESCTVVACFLGVCM